ncbi:MAG: hypothetical protein II816_06630, partial [Elusimicrobia bacterium]|nr:hypothetical protein [Elusimicrobiota bacterium]
MNIKHLLKNFTEQKDRPIKKLIYSFREWVFSLNAVKITAIIVVNCFLLTGVYGHAVAMVLDNQRATEKFRQVFEDFDLPYSYGKITSANYKASDKVVINIQDLHSHPEVQRNISNIISTFDEKYGVKNVFLEGAYGTVSTKWLTVAKDENVKNSVMNKLLDVGRLTGAEYYSASKNKTEIIRGLENKTAYFDNLKRFGTLIDNQETISAHFDSIKDTVKKLQSNYYNRQQKKIEELSAEYTSGKMEPKKYFTLIQRYADKMAVDVDNYPNLALYMEMLSAQKEINYEKTTKQLQEFVIVLKKNLPYEAYKMLVNGTKNFSQMDKLYGYLIKLSREYKLDLSANFSDLERFFAYIELTQRINPMELIVEEQNFKDELNDRFAENKAEGDVVFLSNFIRYYEQYLMGKITAADCAYYKNNIEKFKDLWVKYIDNREIVALADYEKISDTFYKINFDRNFYFMENMKDVLNAKKIGSEIAGANELDKTINSLKNAKEIYITITGGFHTQELSELLSNANITNIVITPNVTGNTKLAEETYYKIAQEQAKISFQALAALNTSQAIMNGDKDAIRILLNSALQSIKNPEDIKAFSENLSYNPANNSITVTINGNTYGYNVNDDWKEVTPQTAAAEETTAGMQKSESTIKQTLRAAIGVTAVSVAVTIGSILAGVTGLWIAIPVVSIISALYGGASFGFLSYQKNLIAKNAIEESDAEDRETINGFLKNNFEDIDENILKEISDRLDASTVAQVEERDGKRLIHLNYSLLNKMFIDEDGNIKNESLLRTVVNHEIRHIGFEDRFGTNHPLLEEILVGMGDFTDFIVSSIKNSKILNSLRSVLSRSKKKNIIGKTIKLSDENIREAIEDVAKRLVSEDYDFMSDRSQKQAEFAEELASPEGKVAVLGTSGGKTFGTAEAMLLQLLRNQQRGLLDNKILFTSKTTQLIKETRDMLVQSFSSSKIRALLPKKLQDKIDAGEMVGFVDQNSDKGYFYSLNEKGEIIEKEVTKKEVYEKAAIICGDFAGFVWDVQKNAQREDAADYLLQEIDADGNLKDVPFDFFADEAQLIRENSNASTSSGEYERAKELEPILDEIVKLVRDESTKRDDVITRAHVDGDNKLTSAGKRVRSRLFKQIKAQYPDLNLKEDEWNARVNFAVNALFGMQEDTDYGVCVVNEDNEVLEVNFIDTNVNFVKKVNNKDEVVHTMSLKDYLNGSSEIEIAGVKYKVQSG